MNPDKSNYGQMPVPVEHVDKITMTSGGMEVLRVLSTANGKNTFTLKYNFDGTETTNTARGTATKSVAKWDEDALAVTTRATVQGADVVFSDKWRMPQGKDVIVIERHIDSPRGQVDQKIILERVSPADANH